MAFEFTIMGLLPAVYPSVQLRICNFLIINHELFYGEWKQNMIYMPTWSVLQLEQHGFFNQNTHGFFNQNFLNTNLSEIHMRICSLTIISYQELVPKWWLCITPSLLIWCYNWCGLEHWYSRRTWTSFHGEQISKIWRLCLKVSRSVIWKFHHYLLLVNAHSK
jgi:hypothetical protein